MGGQGETGIQVTTSARYFSPTEILYGLGSARTTGDEVRRLGGSRALLVTDQGLTETDAVSTILGALRSASVECELYASVPADPTFADVDEIVSVIKGRQSDTIVSVGGGSVLAAGRAAAVAAPNGPARSLAKLREFDSPPLLSVCIPTTAGSGGEVSRQATLTDEATGEKSGLNGSAVAARMAILDGNLLVSVPRRQAVASGVDAMTHSLEAYVSRRATPMTDALALPSFEEIFRLLPKALDDGSAEDWDHLLLASTMANLACGNAGLGLVHGINKGVTKVFHKLGYPSVPYGLLHAILLPWVMEFNVPGAPHRYAVLADLMGVDEPGMDDAGRAAAGISRMKRWLADLDAPRRLPWDNCESAAIQTIIGDTLDRQLARDNPRESTAEDLESIVRSSLTGWESDR